MDRIHRRMPRTRLWLQALEQRETPAVFTVTNVDDSLPGSLRDAITQANTATGADSIVFDSGVFSSAQTINILSVLPNITGDLTITGPGSGLLTVTRSSGSNFRIFTIKNLSGTPTVNISGMSVTNGYCDAVSQTDNGGGIYVGKNGVVTLTDVVVANNQSTAQGGGIAVDETGRLTLINCTITGNTALGLEYGSPIDTSFTGVGGGIYFTLDGNLTVFNSTIDNNTAKMSGGGIFVYGESMGTALIRNSTISSNKVTSSYSSTYYKSGGGGIAILNNLSLSGLYNITIQNSTITANTAAGSSQGGGIQAASIQSNKIATRIESSVVAGNTAGTGPDISGGAGSTLQKVTVDFSAIGSTSGFTLTAGPGGSGSNVVNETFTLGALQYNGGPTRTHMPPSNSKLIDRGSNPGGLSLDQRAFARSYDSTEPGVTGTLLLDIGAVEWQPAGLPTAIASAPDIATVTSGDQTITVVYNDDVGINGATIGAGDITVTGPNGYNQVATFVNKTGSGKSFTATYTVPAPGGTWDSKDAGTYSINMVANQVSDTTPLFVSAGVVGTFRALFGRTLVVNTYSDTINATDGKLSLREAILDANSFAPTTDTITFDPTVFTGGFITLASGQMFIEDSVNIQGPGEFKLFINGSGGSRHFNIDGPGRLNVTISGMTLTGGATKNNFQSERGGSIYLNNEDLTLTDVTFSGNSAQQSYGGAVHIQGQGTLTVNSCDFSTNSSPQFAGGAISALDDGHKITVLNSNLTGNTAGYYGGAIFSSGGGIVTIDFSTIKNNTTTLALQDDQGGTVIRGGGGAIMVANGKVINGSVVEDYPSVSSLFISNSLFDNNATAVSGGAILFNGNTTGSRISNSTFTNNKTGNSQDNVGGAILVGNLQGNPFHIDNCTIAYNSAFGGGGLFVENDNVTSLIATSTIFALNSSADPTQLPPDVDGSIATAINCFFGVSEGVALDGISTGNIGMGSLASPADPGLDFLNDNSGLSYTIALLPTSVCLDAGVNVDNLPFDQRGPGFNRSSGKAPDIGAFELQVATAPRVTDIKIDNGGVQRSMVRSITVTFNQLVDIPTPASAFTLEFKGPGTPGFVGLNVSFANTATETVAVLTFAPGTYVNATSLIDGNYELHVVAGQVSLGGIQLDGNGDGTAGDDRVDTFHRLFGDANGDRSITASDFNAFRLQYGQSGAALDFDYNNDGIVSAADFNNFRTRYGITLQP